jgi:Arc/MetJ family transcription regulator
MLTTLLIAVHDMRTNIKIDDKLIKDALSATASKSQNFGAVASAEKGRGAH